MQKTLIAPVALTALIVMPAFAQGQNEWFWPKRNAEQPTSSADDTFSWKGVPKADVVQPPAAPSQDAAELIRAFRSLEPEARKAVPAQPSFHDNTIVRSAPKELPESHFPANKLLADAPSGDSSLLRGFPWNMQAPAAAKAASGVNDVAKSTRPAGENSKAANPILAAGKSQAGKSAASESFAVTPEATRVHQIEFEPLAAAVFSAIPSPTSAPIQASASQVQAAKTVSESAWLRGSSMMEDRRAKDRSVMGGLPAAADVRSFNEAPAESTTPTSRIWQNSQLAGRASLVRRPIPETRAASESVQPVSEKALLVSDRGESENAFDRNRYRQPPADFQQQSMNVQASIQSPAEPLQPSPILSAQPESFQLMNIPVAANAPSTKQHSAEYVSTATSAQILENPTVPQPSEYQLEELSVNEPGTPQEEESLILDVIPLDRLYSTGDSSAAGPYSVASMIGPMSNASTIFSNLRLDADFRDVPAFPGEDKRLERDESGVTSEWMSQYYAWVAPTFGYNTLYFEQPNLERYGIGVRPCLQPFASAGHFFGTIGLLPLKLLSQHPNDCVYPLGHQRPGDCVRYQRCGLLGDTYDEGLVKYFHR